ncbi:PepSY-associated TM helix domain-containing protein [Thauera sp. Sel9]|uniref:PepSY-associated TM helix domain-containing protein n=1 Tax=Thauera sp. Sel9 TaxID=2974299 RepID=UPI0021E134E9|nr:PepSY-associated TM helix domain-containing protein [Thauera sp. Sel9]MCV2219208.1 PepSY domain-containing protein [Thauera sp. Sel9]
MRFDKPRTFRQSMSWVHTWAGLLLGWLLFAVFVTGTLSFFRNEITLWMQPELHRAHDDGRATDNALRTLERVGSGAQQWTISLPSPRSNVVNLSWREAQPEQAQGRGTDARSGNARGGDARADRQPQSMRAAAETGSRATRAQGERSGPRAADGSRRAGRGADGADEDGEGETPAAPAARPAAATQAPAPQAAAAQAGGGGGRQQPGLHRAIMDPATGELIEARQTAGGNFLYRFHFELYGMDRVWGRWIVGIATMAMFVALITGVIVHRQIFRDFFTFRPAKGKRSWLDAHNASGVLSLPFHLVITFSGLVLLGSMLMPSAVSSAYPEDSAAYGRELRGTGNAAPAPRATGQAAPLMAIAPLLAEGQRRWPEAGVGSISITHPGDAGAIIELRQARGDSLANRGATERLLFNGVSGELLDAPPVTEPSAVRAIQNVLSAVHLGRFASPLPRWLLFLSGVLGSLMVASGLVLWVVSRAKDAPSAETSVASSVASIPRGHRLVQVLNIAAVAGLMIAIAAYFWANRLVPVEQAERNLWEIRTFFSVWGLTLIHALFRRHKQAWIEQLVAAGTLFAALPLLNALSGGMHLGYSLANGQWQVAGFDLTALACGLLLFFTARGVIRHVPRARPNKARPAKTPAPAATTTDAATPGALPSTPAAAPALRTAEHAG